MCPLHRQPGQGIGGRGGVRGQEQVWQLLAAPQEAPGKPGPRPNRKLPLSSQYADPVTDLLDRCGVFRARLFRESCVFHQGCYVKDLSRLGRDLRKTLILDNSPASYIFHPENAVSGPYTHAAGLGSALSWEGRGRGGELWALLEQRSSPREWAELQGLRGRRLRLPSPSPGARAVLV